MDKTIEECWVFDKKYFQRKREEAILLIVQHFLRNEDRKDGLNAVTDMIKSGIFNTEELLLLYFIRDQLKK